jgi:hypothetical protein
LWVVATKYAIGFRCKCLITHTNEVISLDHIYTPNYFWGAKAKNKKNVPFIVYILYKMVG